MSGFVRPLFTRGGVGANFQPKSTIPIGAKVEISTTQGLYNLDSRLKFEKKKKKNLKNAQG